MQLGVHDNEKLHGIIKTFEKSSLRTRFLNASKVGAITTSSGNEFQVGTTRDEKKYLVLLHLATGTANLNLCPL